MTKAKTTKSYKFEIATNRSEEVILVRDVEIYARTMTMSQSLRLNAARKAAEREIAAAKPGDNPPSILEAEVAALVPVIHTLLVNPVDAERVTEEFILDMPQGEYYRLFNFLATGQDLNADDEEGDNPNA